MVPREQFSRAVLDVADFPRHIKRLPGAVWLGSHAAPPEGYLSAPAQAVSSLPSKAARPEAVRVPPAQLAIGRPIEDDSPATWNWEILPSGFHARNPNTPGKFQARTLKPATL
jgi:hypothetical protein